MADFRLRIENSHHREIRIPQSAFRI